MADPKIESEEEAKEFERLIKDLDNKVELALVAGANPYEVNDLRNNISRMGFRMLEVIKEGKTITPEKRASCVSMNMFMLKKIPADFLPPDFEKTLENTLRLSNPEKEKESRIEESKIESAAKKQLEDLSKDASNKNTEPVNDVYKAMVAADVYALNHLDNPKIANVLIDYQSKSRILNSAESLNTEERRKLSDKLESIRPLWELNEHNANNEKKLALLSIMGGISATSADDAFGLIVTNLAKQSTIAQLKEFTKAFDQSKQDKASQKVINSAIRESLKYMVIEKALNKIVEENPKIKITEKERKKIFNSLTPSLSQLSQEYLLDKQDILSSNISKALAINKETTLIGNNLDVSKETLQDIKNAINHVSLPESYKASKLSKYADDATKFAFFPPKAPLVFPVKDVEKQAEEMLKKTDDALASEGIDMYKKGKITKDGALIKATLEASLAALPPEVAETYSDLIANQIAASLKEEGVLKDTLSKIQIKIADNYQNIPPDRLERDKESLQIINKAINTLENRQYKISASNKLKITKAYLKELSTLDPEELRLKRALIHRNIVDSVEDNKDLQILNRKKVEVSLDKLSKVAENNLATRIKNRHKAIEGSILPDNSPPVKGHGKGGHGL